MHVASSSRPSPATSASSSALARSGRASQRSARPAASLDEELKSWLDGYEQVPSVNGKLSSRPSAASSTGGRPPRPRRSTHRNLRQVREQTSIPGTTPRRGCVATAGDEGRPA